MFAAVHESGFWHETDMPTAMRDVRQGQSGKHILAVSFSVFDPTRTSEPLVLTGLFVRHPGQYEGLLGGRRILWSSLKLLFETGRADVSVRGEWQRGMPSAGIALS